MIEGISDSGVGGAGSEINFFWQVPTGD